MKKVLLLREGSSLLPEFLRAHAEVVRDLRGLARLQKLLPGNHKILVSDPTGNSERMAFLYAKIANTRSSEFASVSKQELMAVAFLGEYGASKMADLVDAAIPPARGAASTWPWSVRLRGDAV